MQISTTLANFDLFPFFGQFSAIWLRKSCKFLQHPAIFDFWSLFFFFLFGQFLHVPAVVGCAVVATITTQRSWTCWSVENEDQSAISIFLLMSCWCFVDQSTNSAEVLRSSSLLGWSWLFLSRDLPQFCQNGDKNEAYQPSDESVFWWFEAVFEDTWRILTVLSDALVPLSL